MTNKTNFPKLKTKATQIDSVFFEKKFEGEKKHSFSNFSKKRLQKKRKIRKKMISKIDESLHEKMTIYSIFW